LNQKLTDGKPGDDQPKLEVGSSFLGDVDGKKGNDEPPPMTTTVPARATRINSFRTLKIIWKSLEFSNQMGKNIFRSVSAFEVRLTSTFGRWIEFTTSFRKRSTGGWA
jgi:hypothetical protein